MTNNISLLTDGNKKFDIYHEKQWLQLCAVHSLNNLFQRKIFTKQVLDSIVYEYDKSWCCNEYSTLFVGNYDLTIILDALRHHNYTLRAIDLDESLEKFNFNICFGLLLNVSSERPFIDRLPLIHRFINPGRHWLSIKILDGEIYWNLDSKLSKPKLIGNRTNLIEYLTTIDRTKDYIYIVIKENMMRSLQ